MIERGGGGRIINVSSSSAFRARNSPMAYASSKAALMQLTRSAAAELALWEHAAPNRDAAVANGIGGVQGGEQISVTTCGREGEVSAESIGKMIFPAVACPPDTKPPPSGAGETPWTKTG